MTLRSKFPQYGDAVTQPIGRGLARTGISPNVITTLGLLLTAVATGVVASGRPVLGGGILVVGGLMDTFDGAVARASGRATPFGSFYDSVTDRVSDGVILGGMAWWLRDQPRLFVLVIVALVAAEVTSYVRARAEAIDLDCSVGMMERAERAALLMAGLLFHRWLLEPVLWLLAIGGVVTVVQRIHHVWCQIERDLPEELVAFMLQDRAWNRAFKRAARSFYGEQNFQEAERLAQDGHATADGQAGGRQRATPATDGHATADGQGGGRQRTTPATDEHATADGQGGRRRRATLEDGHATAEGHRTASPQEGAAVEDGRGHGS